MKRILLRNFVLLLLLCVPLQSFGQLSSESYQVVGQAVGGVQMSFMATSTSYSLVLESGGVYIYSTTSESLPETSPSGGTEEVLDDPVVEVDESVSVSLYTQSATVEQGSLVSIVLNLQTTETEVAILGAEAQILVLGANYYLLDADEIGAGVYTASYVAENVGYDFITAKIAGISTGSSLEVQVIEKLISVISDPVSDDSQPSVPSDSVSDTNSSKSNDQEASLSIGQQTNQADSVKDAPVTAVARSLLKKLKVSMPPILQNFKVSIPPALENFEVSVPSIPVYLVEPAEQITTTGIGIGIFATILNFLRIPFSVGRLFATNARNLFGLLAFWKRKRPWGTVYDSVTKAPVDPAYIELFDMQGVKKAESITDLDGRYGFVVPEGLYTMNVRKVNYQFPSKKSFIKKRDVLYNNLYFGGEVSITDAVTHDIPLDPVSFDWNQQEKMRTNQTYFIRRFDHLLALVLDIVFYAGAGVVMWQFISQPDVYTGSVVVLYLILLVLRYKRGGMVLYGVVKKSGTTLPYAIVRVLRNNKEILSRVTDIHGRYVAIVPVGTYMVRIEELVNPDEYRTVYEKKIYAKHGVINSNIKI